MPAEIFATNEARWLGVQVLADAEPDMAAPVAGDTGMGPAQGLISYGTADPIHVPASGGLSPAAGRFICGCDELGPFGSD